MYILNAIHNNVVVAVFVVIVANAIRLRTSATSTRTPVMMGWRVKFFGGH